MPRMLYNYFPHPLVCEAHCVRVPSGWQTRRLFREGLEAKRAASRQPAEGAKTPPIRTAAAEGGRLRQREQPLPGSRVCNPGMFPTLSEVLGAAEYIPGTGRPVINTHFALQMFSPESRCRCGLPRGDCVLWHPRGCHTELGHVRTHLRTQSKMGTAQS